MQVVNINMEQIIIENDINEDEIKKIVEDNGGITLSKNIYTVAENKHNKIKKELNNVKLI